MEKGGKRNKGKKKKKEGYSSTSVQGRRKLERWKGQNIHSSIICLIP